MAGRVGDEVDHPDVSSALEDGTARHEGAGRSLSFSRAYKIPRRHPQEFSTAQKLLLAYQSLGVVYGDLGTSPLYVFSSITLSDPGEKDILGAMSLIFWTLTLIGLIKYVFIVLHADDHGEGGTFALYSLLRQHINFKSRTIVQSTRLESDVNLLYHSKGSALRTKTKHFLEESERAQTVITFIVLLGTCCCVLTWSKQLVGHVPTRAHFLKTHETYCLWDSWEKKKPSSCSFRHGTEAFSGCCFSCGFPLSLVRKNVGFKGVNVGDDRKNVGCNCVQQFFYLVPSVWGVLKCALFWGRSLGVSVRGSFYFCISSTS